MARPAAGRAGGQKTRKAIKKTIKKLVATNRSSRAIIIEGDAGIGKSRLVHELIKMYQEVFRHLQPSNITTSTATTSLSACRILPY